MNKEVETTNLDKVNLDKVNLDKVNLDKVNLDKVSLDKVSLDKVSLDKVSLFRQIVNEMADLYAKKNENYGDSFGKLYSDLGPIAGLVPLHNKLDRATNLVKGGENNFESLEDTFKDLACYAIMNLIEMKATSTSTEGDK